MTNFNPGSSHPPRSASPIYDGQTELITTFTLTADGWSINFSEEVIVDTHAPAINTMGSIISGDWTANSLEDAEITDEFIGGGYALAMAQNIWMGRGRGAGVFRLGR